MGKVLALTLRRRWFDQIAAGTKREEYRALSPYWISRLIKNKAEFLSGAAPEFIEIERVQARNGYRQDSPLVVWRHGGIRIGLPRPEWCDPTDAGRPVFILKIAQLEHICTR